MVIFVGYSPTSKGWRFWNPITDRIMESSDVIFDEDTGYSPSSFTQHHEALVSIPPSVSILDHNPIPLPVPPPILLPPVEPVGESLSTDSIPQIEDDTSDISPFSTPVHIPSNSPPDLAQSANPIDPLPDPHTPSSSHFPPSQSFEEPAHPKFRSLDDIYSASSHPETSTSPSTSFAHMVNTAETFREPATYKQATMSPQAGYWKAAREKEYDSLMENRTWVLVPPPPGRNIIQCKWVYRIKYTSTGEIDKYKARLVAKGYSQVHGIDYTETFSPVIKHDSVRVIFAVAAVLRMHLQQFDIGTAYLNNDLTTRIYMHQPEGFVNLKYPSHVCSLLKSLYRSKQSGRLWNHTFDAFMKLYNLITSAVDTFDVFLKHSMLIPAYTTDLLPPTPSISSLASSWMMV